MPSSHCCRSANFWIFPEPVRGYSATSNQYRGVFCGDTLLIGGVARTDFLGGDAGQLFDSIHGVLDQLPDETVVFPGHDYQGRMRTTLGDERRDNVVARNPRPRARDVLTRSRNRAFD